MVAVEVDNRSGVEVDEDAAVELARARARAPRASTTASSGSRSSAPEEMRALKREHLGIDEATDVLSFPIDGRDALPEGVPRALGDVVLCPAGRRRGLARAARRTGCCTCSATTTATRWRRASEALARERRPARAVAPRQLQLRVRGDHPRAPHAAEHADPLRRSRSSCSSPRSSSACTQLELIALLLAIAFVLIAEMINTAIEGAIDVATTSFDPMAKLAKDIAAGAVLIATVNAVAVGYLVFSGADRRPSSRAARPAARRAGRADARRARRSPSSS